MPNVHLNALSVHSHPNGHSGCRSRLPDQRVLSRDELDGFRRAILRKLEELAGDD